MSSVTPVVTAPAATTASIPTVASAAAVSVCNKRQTGPDAADPDDPMYHKSQKRACMAHICPMNTGTAITVHQFMKVADGFVDIGETTVCQAARCDICFEPFTHGDQVDVRGLGSRSERRVVMNHVKCTESGDTACTPVLSDTCFVIGSSGSAQLPVCSNIQVKLAGSNRFDVVAPKTLCTQCHKPILSGDVVLHGDTATRTAVVHFTCGVRCSAVDCNQFVTGDSLLCSYHVRICTACCGDIKVPADTWVSRVPNGDLFDVKHKTCASAEDLAYAARTIECGQMGCSRAHNFAPYTIYRYDTQKLHSAAPSTVETVLLCSYIRCHCCGEKSARAFGIKCQCLDGQFFCINCLSGMGDAADKRCLCPDADKLLSPLFVPFCPIHIGPGWLKDGKPHTGRCIECSGWVRRYQQDDGCIEGDGKGGAHMVHYSCKAVREKEAAQAQAEKKLVKL